MAVLPPEIWHRILSNLNGYAAAVREVCASWRDATAALGLRSAQIVELANAEHEGLLVWIHERRGGFTQSLAEAMMLRAAKRGRESLVRLARSWHLNLKLVPFVPPALALERGIWSEAFAVLPRREQLIFLATAARFVLLVLLAPLPVLLASATTLALSSQFSESRVDYDKLMASAVDGGSARLVCLAREWGAPTAPDAILARAAARGHAGLMRLAREWGATDYEAAARAARTYERPESEELLRAWASGAEPVGGKHEG